MIGAWCLFACLSVFSCRRLDFWIVGTVVGGAAALGFKIVVQSVYCYSRECHQMTTRLFDHLFCILYSSREISIHRSCTRKQ